MRRNAKSAISKFTTAGMSIGISNDMGRIQKGDEALAHSPSHVAFAILLAAVLSVSMAYGVTLPFLPFLLERLMGPSQLSAMPWHAGLLTGLYTIAIFLLSPFWGILSDRMNWRVIPIGLFGSSISLVVLDDVSSMTTLYAAITNATDNALLFGATYALSLNVRADLTYVKYSGDLYNAASQAIQGAGYMGDNMYNLTIVAAF